MKKTIVLCNGEAFQPESDYTEPSLGVLAFTFKLRGKDIVMIETYEEGVLVQRDIYNVLDTPKGEKIRWHRRVTEKFRDKDCGG